jgi:hypothetical protein
LGKQELLVTSFNQKTLSQAATRTRILIPSTRLIEEKTRKYESVFKFPAVLKMISLKSEQKLSEKKVPY